MACDFAFSQTLLCKLEGSSFLRVERTEFVPKFAGCLFQSSPAQVPDRAIRFAQVTHHKSRPGLEGGFNHVKSAVRTCGYCQAPFDRFVLPFNPFFGLHSVPFVFVFLVGV
jgi:hypothetical protein